MKSGLKLLCCSIKHTLDTSILDIAPAQTDFSKASHLARSLLTLQEISEFRLKLVVRVQQSSTSSLQENLLTTYVVVEILAAYAVSFI